MSPDDRRSHDAVTTPVGITTRCPQCGVVLDALTTSCGACSAVITAGGAAGDRAERVRSRLQDAIGDSYVLAEMIGRGGMGMVFRAREKALDRDVALKVLAFDPVLNPEAYERFEREARLAAGLDHPNIVPIFAVGQRNGVAFYTMRLVRQGSVEQRLAAGGLALAEAVGILRDVAAALDYAHASGVVHRDIKPANVLIGDSGHAMVADFGIARAYTGAVGPTSTGTGVVGSPAYMSPEQWRGEKVDGRADQYALGILAFELLTGRRPFADAPMQELLRMHLSEEPPDIVSYRADLPAHITDAVWRAMAKDPADRYLTAGAFIDDLTGGAGGQAHSRERGPADSSRSAAARTTVRHFTPPPKAASLQTAAATATRLTHPRNRMLWLVAALLIVAGGSAAAWAAIQRGRNEPVVSLPAASAAPVVTSRADSSPSPAEIENAKLQQEVADARRIALDADHKMEQLLASQRVAARTAAPPAPDAHAHLFVMVQGGKPAVFVDGERLAGESPAVIEVRPGRHIVTVQGSGTEYRPAQYSVDLSASDTTTVAFQSRAVVQRQRQQRQLADPSLTLEQRQRYMQQFRKRMDASKGRRPPVP